MKKEIIKLHSVKMKIYIWILAIFTVSIGVLIMFLSDAMVAHMPHLTIMIPIIGGPFLIVTGSLLWYYIYFCGKIIIDPQKKSFFLWRMLRKSVPFDSVSNITLERKVERNPNNFLITSTGYIILFHLDSGEVVKCEGSTKLYNGDLAKTEDIVYRLKRYIGSSRYKIR